MTSGLIRTLLNSPPTLRVPREGVLRSQRTKAEGSQRTGSPTATTFPSMQRPPPYEACRWIDRVNSDGLRPFLNAGQPWEWVHAYRLFNFKSLYAADFANSGLSRLVLTSPGQRIRNAGVRTHPYQLREALRQQQRCERHPEVREVGKPVR